jgi:hypothetical protein
MIMKNIIIIIILIRLMEETMGENSMIRKIIIIYRMNIEEHNKIIKHLTIKIILIIINILINSLKIVCRNILHGAQLLKRLQIYSQQKIIITKVKIKNKNSQIQQMKINTRRKTLVTIIEKIWI